MFVGFRLFGRICGDGFDLISIWLGFDFVLGRFGWWIWAVAGGLGGYGFLFDSENLMELA